MLYHASPVAGLTVLRPHISNHGVPILYFSQKRENTLVYLSNAVEKFCRETGFAYDGPWQKWGPYGFTADGRQRLEEYYPNALEETYAGVSGYIYGAEPANTAPVSDVPFAVTSEEAVAVVSCEFVPDAYEAILRAGARRGHPADERAQPRGGRVLHSKRRLFFDLHRPRAARLCPLRQGSALQRPLRHRQRRGHL